MSNLIIQRETDKYLFVTPICQKYGKLFGHYLENQATKDKIERIKKSFETPINLIVSVRTGKNHLRGSYIHPKLMIHFGSWVSPEFMDLLEERLSNPLPPPVHRIQRYKTWEEVNSPKVPITHFAIAGEVINILAKELLIVGYTLCESIIPEISVGRLFYGWLKELRGSDIEVKKYPHLCSSGVTADTKMYPTKYLSDFREFVLNRWFPLKSWGYFSERDNSALPFLDKLVSDRGFPPLTKPLKLLI